MWVSYIISRSTKMGVCLIASHPHKYLDDADSSECCWMVPGTVGVDD